MVPFWSRKSHDPAIEDPQETLRRLQAEAARQPQPTAGPSTTGGPSLRLRRDGYDIAEVDAFLATIDTRTAIEIRTVVFNSARRKQGYDQDDVDQLLDQLEAKRAALELNSDP
jgi:DivIVA domain-containing protein